MQSIDRDIKHRLESTNWEADIAKQVLGRRKRTIRTRLSVLSLSLLAIGFWVIGPILNPIIVAENFDSESAIDYEVAATFDAIFDPDEFNDIDI